MILTPSNLDILRFCFVLVTLYAFRYNLCYIVSFFPIVLHLPLLPFSLYMSFIIYSPTYSILVRSCRLIGSFELEPHFFARMLLMKPTYILIILFLSWRVTLLILLVIKMKHSKFLLPKSKSLLINFKNSTIA